MNAEEVWADFDEIVDLDSICKSTLAQRISLVNRVSSACCMQVINLLHDLRRTDELELKEVIEAKYEQWRDLHLKLLNL